MRRAKQVFVVVTLCATPVTIAEAASARQELEQVEAQLARLHMQAEALLLSAPKAVPQVRARIEAHGTALQREGQKLQEWLDVWRQSVPRDAEAAPPAELAAAIDALERRVDSGWSGPTPNEHLVIELSSARHVPSVNWDVTRQPVMKPGTN